MKRQLLWLYKELPVLVQQGVLSEEEAERIRRHYGPLAPPGIGLAGILLAVLGALCVGAGTILLLAHNWDTLSRPVRTGLSFAPLVSGQILCLWVLLRRSESIAWREAVGTFTALAVGACIALIGQTYHIPGDTRAFLLCWVLLGMPLIYILHSSAVAMLYMAGVLGWTFTGPWWNESEAGFWPLTLLLIPHLYWALRDNPKSPRVLWLSGAFCVYCGISMFSVLDHDWDGFWTVIYATMAGLFALSGIRWGERAAFLLVRILGVIGVILLSLVLSFSEMWDDFGHHFDYQQLDGQGFNLNVDYAVALALLGLTAVVALGSLRERTYARLMWVGPAVLTLIFLPLVTAGFPPVVAAIAFNLFLVVLGIGLMRSGVLADRIGLLNLGMCVILLVILMRFFDSDLGFTERGIAFLLAGAAFLGCNVYMARRRRGNGKDAST